MALLLESSHCLHPALFCIDRRRTCAGSITKYQNQQHNTRWALSAESVFKGILWMASNERCFSLAIILTLSSLNSISQSVKRRKGCVSEETQTTTLRDNNSINPPTSIFNLKINMKKQWWRSRSKQPRCQIFPGFTRNCFSHNSNFILGLFIFNWRITDVQYCVGFCHTSTWISHRYTCVPSLLILPPTVSPIPPLKVVTELRLEFQSQTAHSHWLSTLHMVYVFPCFSLHSSHPLLPSLHLQGNSNSWN